MAKVNVTEFTGGVAGATTEVTVDDDRTATIDRSGPPILLRADRSHFQVTTLKKCIGIDRGAGVCYFHDTGTNQLKQSTDWGTTLSSSKGIPTGVDSTSLQKVVRFGDYLYLMAVDSADSTVGIWRAAPAAGNTAFTWSSKLFTFASGATKQGPGLNADGTVMVAGDYGDPVGGPSIYRITLADANGAGTNWQTVWGPGSNRHVHGVFPDMGADGTIYNPGHWWASIGDGANPAFLLSTDYGATWAGVAELGSGAWNQTLQMSFSQRWVFCALDNNLSSVAVFDRDELVFRLASPNYHYNDAFPAVVSTTKRYSPTAFYGTVDPNTGIYYCGTPISASLLSAVWWLPYPGARLELWAGELTLAAGEFFIGGGYCFTGVYRFTLADYATLT